MIRLLQIEWLKTRSDFSFWILMAIYGVGMYVVCSLGTVLLNATFETYSTEGTAEVPMLNIYEFPDIWHNLTYLASYVKIIPGILIIVSVSNETVYRTLRQNLIDGLSPLEFVFTKSLKILLISIIATFGVIGITLYFGVSYADNFTWEYANRNIEFAGAFFLQILGFMLMSLTIGLLIKSMGLAIVLTLAYTFFIETVLKWIFMDSDGIIASLLPIQSLNNLIQAPFNLFDPESVQTQIENGAVIIVGVWCFIYLAASYFLIAKKDH